MPISRLMSSQRLGEAVSICPPAINWGNRPTGVEVILPNRILFRSFQSTRSIVLNDEKCRLPLEILLLSRNKVETTVNTTLLVTSRTVSHLVRLPACFR